MPVSRSQCLVTKSLLVTALSQEVPSHSVMTMEPNTINGKYCDKEIFPENTY
jgi:hypothetical protein